MKTFLLALSLVATTIQAGAESIPARVMDFHLKNNQVSLKKIESKMIQLGINLADGPAYLNCRSGFTHDYLEIGYQANSAFLKWPVTDQTTCSNHLEIVAQKIKSGATKLVIFSGPGEISIPFNKKLSTNVVIVEAE